MSVKTVTATINGSNVTLTLNSSTGKYEATVTAPSKSSYTQSGHYYNVKITATDDAGNTTTKDASDSTLGSSLQLKVKEKVAPVVTITYPTSGAYLATATPTIKWTVTDDDSGVASCTLKVDGTAVDSSKITKTSTTGGYTYSYTPSAALGDGSHTITVDATDNDGNAATQKSASFTTDTVAPTLNVSSPADKLVTNNSSLTVSGTTSDATSKIKSITVNGSAATVNSDGSWSKTITLSSGSNTITIVATDNAGKTTTVTRTVTLDTGAPVISAVTLNPNPVDAGKTYVISVTVTD